MLTYFTRLLVSLGLMALILMRVNFENILNQISSSNMPLFALATLCIAGQIFFLNLRWHYILNAGHYKIPFDRSALINITSYFANILFVTSIGGIIAKSALAIKEGTSITHAILATAIDRLMTLATLVLFIIFALPVLLGVLDTKTENILAFSLLATVASIILVLIFFRTNHFNQYTNSKHKLAQITTFIKSFIQSPTLLMKISYNSILAQSLFFLSTYILSTDMNYDGSTIQFLALLPVLALISSLPISFGGWGVREGAFVYGLGIIGFSMENAFLLSVQVGLVTLIAPFLVALPYAFKKENNLLFFLQETRKTKKQESQKSND